MQAEIASPKVESPEVAALNGSSNGHAPRAEVALEVKSAPVFEPRRYRFTREELYRMAEAGLFEDKRVELIDGEILEMAPMLTPHAVAVNKIPFVLFAALNEAVNAGQIAIRTQSPLTLGDNGEPEPDIAVVTGSQETYLSGHPTTALLIIEISDTTLRHDRTIKASLYASARVPDYWILNVRARQLEVRRDPQPDADARFGWSYGSLQTLGAEDVVALLFGSQAQITVAELLPPQS